MTATATAAARRAAWGRAASARVAGVAAIAAGICYSSFLLSPLTHAGKAADGDFVSELELPGQPFAWLYRLSDCAAGVGMLITAALLPLLLPRRRWLGLATALLAVAGVSSVLDGATRMRCDPSTDRSCARGEQSVYGLIGQLSAIHTETGVFGLLGAAGAAIILGAAMVDRNPGWGRLQLVLGSGIAVAGLADVGLLLAARNIGDVERARILLTTTWLLVLGAFLTRSCHSAPEGSPARPSATCRATQRSP